MLQRKETACISFGEDLGSKGAVVPMMMMMMTMNYKYAITTSFTSGTLTSIETSKWKWLGQKLDDSLGSTRRDSFITITSMRSGCSTTVSCNAELKEQNHFS